MHDVKKSNSYLKLGERNYDESLSENSLDIFFPYYLGLFGHACLCS